MRYVINEWPLGLQVLFVFVLAPVAKTEFCQVLLDETKLKAFMYAVKNHYWYQMYVDDLPIWGKTMEIFFTSFSWFSLETVSLLLIQMPN